MIIAQKTLFRAFILIAMVTSGQNVLVAQQEAIDVMNLNLKDFAGICGELCGNPTNIKRNGTAIDFMYKFHYTGVTPIALTGTLAAVAGKVIMVIQANNAQLTELGQAVLFGGLGVLALAATLFTYYTVIYKLARQGKAYITFDPEGIMVSGKRVVKWSDVGDVIATKSFFGALAHYKNLQDKPLYALKDQAFLPTDINRIIAISKHYMKILKRNQYLLVLHQRINQGPCAVPPASPLAPTATPFEQIAAPLVPTTDPLEQAADSIEQTADSDDLFFK